jgi:hypothetical protein
LGTVHLKKTFLSTCWKILSPKMSWQKQYHWPLS